MSTQKPLELWPETPTKTRRLGKQQAAVKAIMADGRWYTIEQVREALERDHGITATETGVSTRMRDLRKPQYGGYTVERQPVRGVAGLFEYRLQVGA